MGHYFLFFENGVMMIPKCWLLTLNLLTLTINFKEIIIDQAKNRPFPSSLVPLFQSESKCETIVMKMTLICMKIKLHMQNWFSYERFHTWLILKQAQENSEMA